MALTSTTDSARRVDLKYRIGTNFAKTIAVTNAADNSNYDFTGHTVHLYVKRRGSGTNLVDFVSGSEITLTAGQILIEGAYNDAQLSALLNDTYYYELEVTNASDIRSVWLVGRFIAYDNDIEDDTPSGINISVSTNPDSIAVSVTTYSVAGPTIASTNVTVTGPFEVIQSPANLEDYLVQNDTALLNARSTGIRFGADMSIVPPTGVTITAGAGQILDNTDPTMPQYYSLTWADQTNVALATLSPNITYWYFDNTGTLQQTTSAPTRSERRTRLYIGRSIYSATAGAIIQVAVDRDYVQQIGQQLRDLADVIGLAKFSGLQVNTNGANLNINRTSGTLFDFGSNGFLDPHHNEFATANAATFQYVTQVTSTGVNTTLIDPNNYDVGGVITPVTSNRFTIQEVYLFQSGALRVTYGQNQYTSLTNAEEAIQTRTITPNPALSLGIRIAYIIVKQGTTALNNTANCKIINTNKFGELGGGSVSAGSGYLEILNNLSDLDNATTARTNLGLGTTDTPVFDGVDINSAQFNAIASPAHNEGLLFRDTATNALTYYNNEAQVALQLGLENYIQVRNTTGATILNGQAVYVVGATGFRPHIALAQANSNATSECIGIATHDIENNTNGYVTTLGVINNLNTSGFTAGDQLYLSSTVAGGLQNTKPTGTNNVVIIGTCLVSNPTLGQIKVQLRAAPDSAIKSVAQTITGAYTFTQGLTVASDTDATNIFGRARIDSRISDIAYFSHFDITANNDAALRQEANGRVTIGSPSLQAINFSNGGTTRFNLFSNVITMSENTNWAFGTTTGTRIGTGTTQKLAFWNATPIVQPAHIADPVGGATVDTEARTAIAAINAVLAATGLTAAS